MSKLQHMKDLLVHDKTSKPETRTVIRWLLALLMIGLTLPPVGNVSMTRAQSLTFTALEIFPGEVLTVPAPLFQNPKADNTAVPAGLPVGSIVLFVIQGVVKDVKVDQATGGEEWQIGSQPVFVYTLADTRKDNSPKKGDLVKVIANRTLASGPIVAERITRRQLGPLPVGIADIEMAFLLTGLVTQTSNHTWVIGGSSFIVDDPEFPADIEPGLGVGSNVTVEFIAAVAP